MMTYRQGAAHHKSSVSHLWDKNSVGSMVACCSMHKTHSKEYNKEKMWWIFPTRVMVEFEMGVPLDGGWPIKASR